MSQTSSPCSRLNDDVLREIFIHCIIHPGNAYNSFYHKEISKINISKLFIVSGYYKPPFRQQPQLTVSQVCSSWRDIALLTPQLWDNIHISYLNDANLSTAREYLSRAKNLPVAMTIQRRPWIDGQPELPWQDWCSQLTAFLSSYRIRILQLKVLTAGKTPPFHLILSDLPQRSVAELESLYISTRYDQEQEQIDLNDTRYPKLEHVHIGGVYKSSSFNSSSLRIFDGMRLQMTVRESWDLLSRCPSLEESHLRITKVNGSRMPVSMPQIHLQCLRILVLDSKSEITFSTFIEVLTLPVVEILLVARGWSAIAFQSLAHRSNYFPHLRDFTLAYPTSIVDAGALLTLMPRLTRIFLSGTNRIIFDHLALDGLASGSLAPRLQTLSVGSILNAESFLDMVESRMQNAQRSSNGVPAPFTEVVIWQFNQRYMNRLLDLQQRGIPIEARRGIPIEAQRY
ncbi:hypothetical protein M378DRAFT_13182 [Amanita muscaria Koide BX008]|uniref:Uncharacterized protein n=1 Tax=Amanita muscaria (strain Koide BX008) TaxID=946122 RepID=A0A0C2T5Z8_AMAMK|nr:hypothetical protein M378DRAFT_13182 [Amanita muscaria Koide BX008]